MIPDEFDNSVDKLVSNVNDYAGPYDDVVCTVPEVYLLQLREMGLFTSHPFACYSGGVYVVKPVTTTGNNIHGYKSGYISLGDAPPCPDTDAPMLRFFTDKRTGMWHVNGQDCSGGMGPADFVNEWVTPEEAISDIRDFFFGDSTRMEAKGSFHRRNDNEIG